MEPIINVENVSKRYVLRHEVQEPYTTLRDSIVKGIRGIFKPQTTVSSEDFWALRDVNFQVQQGDRIGIIGRNGAGKSTLLKVLSRITEPSTGRITINGRVASLLEVGTGFHPELSGRENIYLNGSILGMGRQEIKKKFDEIVAFAEVERFLDTPVKRYSSGMYVRLAFAVAAHLEPEILIVDEVLAVGDAEFQKKCLGKMQEVTGEGRTVLFVSHNMAAIQSLCNKSILLSRGSIEYSGDTEHAVQRYLSTGVDNSAKLLDRTDRIGDGKIRFTSIHFEDDKGNKITGLQCGQDGKIVMGFKKNSADSVSNLIVAACLDNEFGHRVVTMSNEYVGSVFRTVSESEGVFELSMSRVSLQPGRYTIVLFSSSNGNITDWIQEAGVLDVEPGDYYGFGKLPPKDQGLIFTPFTLKIR